MSGSRLGEWVLGPIEWPRTLVPWRAIRGTTPEPTDVRAIATVVAISPQLLGYAKGVEGWYERWPKFSIRDLIPAMMTSTEAIHYSVQQ